MSAVLEVGLPCEARGPRSASDGSGASAADRGGSGARLSAPAAAGEPSRGSPVRLSDGGAGDRREQGASEASIDGPLTAEICGPKGPVGQAVAVPVEDEDFEGRIFAERLIGHSERAIGRRYGIPASQVREIVIKLSPTIDHARRHEEVALERKGMLLGIDRAPARESTPLPAVPEHKVNSTERIREILDRLCAEGRASPLPQIEGPAENPEPSRPLCPQVRPPVAASEVHTRLRRLRPPPLRHLTSGVAIDPRGSGHPPRNHFRFPKVSTFRPRFLLEFLGLPW